MYGLMETGRLGMGNVAIQLACLLQKPSLQHTCSAQGNMKSSDWTTMFHIALLNKLGHCLNWGTSWLNWTSLLTTANWIRSLPAMIAFRGCFHPLKQPQTSIGWRHESITAHCAWPFLATHRVSRDRLCSSTLVVIKLDAFFLPVNSPQMSVKCD